MQWVGSAVAFVRSDDQARQVLSTICAYIQHPARGVRSGTLTVHATADLSVLPIMHLGPTVVKTMTVIVHPMHFCQYPILGLAFGRKGEVTDDLGAGWNEFLLNIFPGLGHLGFDFEGHGRRGPLRRVQVSGSAGNTRQNR